MRVSSLACSACAWSRSARNCFCEFSSSECSLALGKFSLQFGATLGQLARLSLNVYATVGLLPQRVGQCPDSLFHLHLSRLGLLNPGFEPGLLDARGLLECAQLLLRGFQLD